MTDSIRWVWRSRKRVRQGVRKRKAGAVAILAGHLPLFLDDAGNGGIPVLLGKGHGTALDETGPVGAEIAVDEAFFRWGTRFCAPPWCWPEVPEDAEYPMGFRHSFFSFSLVFLSIGLGSCFLASPDVPEFLIIALHRFRHPFYPIHPGARSAGPAQPRKFVSFIGSLLTLYE